jgi:polygalacturonase
MAWAALQDIVAALLSNITFNGAKTTRTATGLTVDLGRIDVTAAPYNAAGDGVTDDTAAIQAAEAAALAAGSYVTYPPGTYRLAGDVALGACRFDAGASLLIEDGAVVTISGDITAAPNQELFLYNGGQVKVTRQQRVYANWWTVSGDDIATRWNRCVRACRGNGPTEIALVGTHSTAGQFDLSGWGATAVTFDLSGARLTTSSENPFRLRGSTNAQLLLGATDHNDGVT